MNHFMKVKMTSAKLKSWLRDAELVSSGLESGSMPIAYCASFAHWAISSALLPYHYV